MKFYQDDKAGIVWNPKRKQAGAVFEDGLFEAQDDEVISLLVRGGYRADAPVAVKSDVAPELEQPLEVVEVEKPRSKRRSRKKAGEK